MFFPLLITLYRTCLPILSRASVPTHLSFPPTLPWLEPLLESRICNCSHHRISCVSRCISGLLLFPGIKIGGREVQPSAALYPTVRLSPWRQVRKNIHSRVGTPGSTWSVLPPGRAPPPPPLLVPLVPRDYGIWASPTGDSSGPFSPGWLPPVPPDLFSAQEGTPLLVLRIPSYSRASLPPKFCPLFVCCVTNNQ